MRGCCTLSERGCVPRNRVTRNQPQRARISERALLVPRAAAGLRHSRAPPDEHPDHSLLITPVLRPNPSQGMGGATVSVAPLGVSPAESGPHTARALVNRCHTWLMFIIGRIWFD